MYTMAITKTVTLLIYATNMFSSTKGNSFLPLVCSMSTAAGFDVLASNLPDYLNKFNRSLFVPFSLFLGRSFPFFSFVLLNGTPFSVGAQTLPTSSKLFPVNACHIFVLFHKVCRY